jgi:hypothetical protein
LSKKIKLLNTNKNFYVDNFFRLNTLLKLWIRLQKKKKKKKKNEEEEEEEERKKEREKEKTLILSL